MIMAPDRLDAIIGLPSKQITVVCRMAFCHGSEITEEAAREKIVKALSNTLNTSLNVRLPLGGQEKLPHAVNKNTVAVESLVAFEDNDH